MRLEGNTIVITGGGSGIGLGLAAALLKRGNTVIVTGRDAAKLEAAAQANPGLLVRRCDVTRDAELDELLAWLEKEHPGFNVLVNNAAVMSDWDLRDPAHPAAKIEQEIATNLTAPVKLIRLALPRLLQAKAAAIVNVSSGVAYAPLPKAPLYSATKAALHSFTQALRLQLEGTPVKVFEVVPALVSTPMSGARYDNPEKFESPESFARSVLRGLEGDTPEIRPGDSTSLYFLSRVIGTDFFSRLMDKRTRGERKG